MSEWVGESSTFKPTEYVAEWLAQYGWWVMGAAAVLLYAAQYLKPAWHRWQQARDDAAYHKDPDRVAARLAAEQRTRELQQQQLAAASERALQLQKEREEKKRLEAVERLARYKATDGAGHRLGTPDDGYLPLSGGPSGSSYRAPKRSACSRGGCGR